MVRSGWSQRRLGCRTRSAPMLVKNLHPNRSAVAVNPNIIRLFNRRGVIRRWSIQPLLQVAQPLSNMLCISGTAVQERPMFPDIFSKNTVGNEIVGGPLGNTNLLKQGCLPWLHGCSTQQRVQFRPSGFHPVRCFELTCPPGLMLFGPAKVLFGFLEEGTKFGWMAHEDPPL